MPDTITGFKYTLNWDTVSQPENDLFEHEIQKNLLKFRPFFRL